MVLDEKDRLTDALVTEKYISNGYNTATIESANSQLMEAFAGILRDEHQIQHEIFLEMHNRGWYRPKAADMNELSQNMNKWNQELQRVQNMAFRQPTTHQQEQHQRQQHQQPGFQGSHMPQYGFQTGVGMPQANEQQRQTMYRPPQNPMI